MTHLTLFDEALFAVLTADPMFWIMLLTAPLAGWLIYTVLMVPDPPRWHGHDRWYPVLFWLNRVLWGGLTVALIVSYCVIAKQHGWLFFWQ